MNGSVSNILAEKNFGFITGEDGREYFFHISCVQGSWNKLVADFKIAKTENAIKVSFEPILTPKGLRAESVIVEE